jgi:hypothetical protein
MPKKNPVAGTRRPTRRLYRGEPLPRFLINGKVYLSVYDVRSFLSYLPNSDEHLRVFHNNYTWLRRTYKSEVPIFTRGRFHEEERFMRHISPNGYQSFVPLDRIFHSGKIRFLGYLWDVNRIPVSTRLYTFRLR